MIKTSFSSSLIIAVAVVPAPLSVCCLKRAEARYKQTPSNYKIKTERLFEVIGKKNAAVLQNGCWIDTYGVIGYLDTIYDRQQKEVDYVEP